MTGTDRRPPPLAIPFCLLLALLVPFPSSSRAAQAGPDEGGKAVPFQDELFLKNKETGVSRPTVRLGGEAGSATVNGVTATLFVLQADSPERFRTAGATTHKLTVALKDDKGGIIPDADVSLRVSGKGEERETKLERYGEKFYRGQVRMAEAGEYRVEIRFRAGALSGVAPVTLTVEPPKGSGGKAP